jgi:hypothetical protein
MIVRIMSVTVITVSMVVMIQIIVETMSVQVQIWQNIAAPEGFKECYTQE